MNIFWISFPLNKYNKMGVSFDLINFEGGRGETNVRWEWGRQKEEEEGEEGGGWVFLLQKKPHPTTITLQNGI